MRTSPDAARRAWLRGAAALGLAAAAGVTPARAAGLQVGGAAPPLVLHALDGSSVSTGELLGKVVVLAFWASWCDPCRAELPLLSDYARRHREQGLRVLGFSLDAPDDLGAVRAIAANLSFPVGLLGSAYAGGYGRIWRLPVSFCIDRAGRLADNGWDDPEPAWTEARLQGVLGPLLTQPV